MKIAIAASVLVLLASVHESGAFSIQPRSNLQAVTKTIHLGRKYNPSSTLLFLSKAQHKHQEQLSNGNSVQQRNQNNENIWRSLATVVRKRSDTLRAAGFYENENSKEFIEPVTAGAKTNITLFLLALGYKWYRSIFINKMAIWERQPQWNTVITSKEDEEKANLEALTCKNCGATIFIAKGRKWFQMPRGYECYACGASGNDNFENTREELLNEIDDDYFDYEKPLDFITAAERRKLMREAGGDEEKAIALLTQQNMEATEAGKDGDSNEETPKKKKKKKKGKKKKKKAEVEAAKEEEGDGGDSPSAPEASGSKEEKSSTDGDLDVLGMD